jgi:predicted small secreted protein
MNTMIRHYASLLILVLFVGGIAGCNTVRGVGQDTEAAGKAIEREADEASK